MKFTVCGYYGVSNAGDEAILEVFKKIIFNAHPGSSVSVMGSGCLFPFGLRSFLKALICPSLWKKPYQCVKNCEVFILGGGGLFTSEESFYSPLFWALHGWVALLLKKPLYCLGISVVPLKGINKILVKNIFKKARAITVRDPASFELLKKWGIKCILASDLAVLLENVGSHKQVNEKASEKYIVISARHFKNSDEKLSKILVQFCNKVVEKYGLNVRLIPFQKGEQYDHVVLNTIFTQVVGKTVNKEHIFYDRFYDNIYNLLQILGGAEVVVAMRLHAGIFALVCETPFIPLSYMQKVADFWGEFDTIQPTQFKNATVEKVTEQLIRSLDNILKNLEHEKANVRKIKQILRERAGENIKVVQSVKR